jgi:hypothetical protein
VTIRALALGAIFTLALLPTTAAALSPVEEASCPAPIVIDGVTVVPDGAPADCVYTQEQTQPDPCAPDEAGNTPLMCQNQAGGDATLSYLIDTVSLVGGGRWNVPYGMLAIEGDQLSASVGCNRMSGLVDRHGTLDSESATPILLHLRNGLMMTMMFCADLAEAESGLAQILNGDNLALYALDGDRAVIESDAGSASLTLIAETAPVDQGDTAARDSGVFASLLLLFPLLVGALGIAVGLSGDRGRR